MVTATERTERHGKLWTGVSREGQWWGTPLMHISPLPTSHGPLCHQFDPPRIHFRRALPSLKWLLAFYRITSKLLGPRLEGHRWDPGLPSSLHLPLCMRVLLQLPWRAGRPLHLHTPKTRPAAMHTGERCLTEASLEVRSAPTRGQPAPGLFLNRPITCFLTWNLWRKFLSRPI